MKERIIFGLLFSLFAISGYGQENNDNMIPFAPEKDRRPENFQPFTYKYSLTELKDSFSNELMQNAARQYEAIREVNNKGKWKPTPASIDSHQVPEWFIDAKFGMFIDWGLWSVAGWAPKKEEGAMYPDWYEFQLDKDSAFIAYHEKNWGKDFGRDDFLPLFTASDYNPESLVNIAKNAGMKYIVPFCKHHGGLCLWPSSYTQRDAGDMGPKNDLIKPLVDICQKEGLKFGFYFSIEEWEYPVTDSEGKLVERVWGDSTKLYTSDLEKKASGKIALKNFTTDYLVPQAVEFIDNYDPDLIWFDGDWQTEAEELHTYDIASYFYNMAEGRKEVAVNDRYGTEGGKWLRSRRGDFYTNEYGDMAKDAIQSVHAWEECRGISQSFGYNWQDTEENVINSKAFIDMFVDIVAKGGNLLLIVNLDGKGALPKIQEDRLKDIGKWLKVNGEGIYETRPFIVHLDTVVDYTQSKNKKFVYAIVNEWPGKELKLKSVTPCKGTEIYLLGVKEPLRWSFNKSDGITIIKIPDVLQDVSKRPCEYAYTFKISIN